MITEGWKTWEGCGWTQNMPCWLISNIVRLVNRNRSDSPALWQEQSLPQSPTTRPDQSHCRVLPRPTWLQIHTAEVGEGLNPWEAAGVLGDSGRRIQPYDRCVWQLRHPKVLRVWHTWAEIYLGPKSNKSNLPQYLK